MTVCRGSFPQACDVQEVSGQGRAETHDERDGDPRRRSTGASSTATTTETPLARPTTPARQARPRTAPHPTRPRPRGRRRSPTARHTRPDIAGDGIALVIGGFKRDALADVVEMSAWRYLMLLPIARRGMGDKTKTAQRAAATKATGSATNFPRRRRRVPQSCESSVVSLVYSSLV